MTIPNTARKAGPLLGTGSQTAWPFTFKVFATGDVQVTIANSAGTETLLVLGTDYTVTLNSNQDTSPGGTVNYPISGAALPVGSVLAIIGDLDYDQPLDLPSGGNFSPLALENQLDRATMQIQQLKEEVDRSAKLPPTSSESVEALVDDLQRIADSADNLDTVADNIADIATVADDLNEPVSEINTVAASITNVNAVGSNITSVNTVAGISANVTTVAGIAANVTAVAGIAANVTAVAGVAAAVTAVAAIDDDVSIAAANVADITNFADVYQGAKASDPALRNDGSALQAGDLYFNTTNDEMRVYGGTLWKSGFVGTVAVQNFSGNGSTTAFTLTTAPGGENNTQVYIGGVYQQKDQYSVSGTTLTFSTAPTTGTNNVEVVTISTLALGETDATLVSFVQAGAGAVERTAQGKMREFVSVKDFGAVGNGIADDSAAFLAAHATGKAVFVPAGTYLVNVNLTASNTFMFGEGAVSILKPFDPDSRACVEVTSPNLATVYENITFRDLSFQADVATLGFFEFAHLLMFRGVKHVLVDNCEFIGFRGDGIVISEAVNNPADARTNTDVKIANCFIDGVNKDNRNGISVVGCDGCIIENNFITRTSRFNMPGAIDVEPNSSVHYRTNNIVIRNNVIKDIGGNVGAISFFLPGVAYTTYPRGIIVEGNFIEGCYTGFFFNYAIAGGLGPDTPDMSVVFSNNTVTNCTYRPFEITNVKGIVVENNLFNTSNDSGIIGFNTGNQRVTDATFRNNRFVTVANQVGGGAGVSIFTVVRLTLDGNLFYDCGGGAAANSFGIAFLTGTSSFVSLINNTITSPNGKTLTRNILASGHTFSSTTNTFTTNKLLAGLANDFLWLFGDAVEGSFTPVITAAVPGNLAITYQFQLGRFQRVGNRVHFNIAIGTTSFTHTTASGQFQITGLPYVVANLGTGWATPGTVAGRGITKSGYTQFTCFPTAGQTYLGIAAMASGLSDAGINITDLPTSSTVQLYISGSYLV